MQRNRREFLASIGTSLVGAIAVWQIPTGVAEGLAEAGRLHMLNGPVRLSGDMPVELDPFDVALGRRFRMAREALEMHQTDAAAFIHKSQATVSDYELGKAKVSPRDMDRFCLLYRLTADQILGRQQMPDWSHRIS